jgi:hypothetical protein
VRHAYTFDPFTNSWTRVDSMSEARWYPTSTALADGRQLVTSGSHDLWINFFGGRRNSEPVPRDEAIFRYGLGENGHADDPVRTGSGTDWPSPREGHTSVLVGQTTFVFGGKDSTSTDSSGSYFDDYWQLNLGTNDFGADFDYQWAPFNITSTKPPARWDHTAVPTPDPLAPMIIFGGIKKDLDHPDVVLGDVWRLQFVPDQGGWKWFQVFPTGTAPGPRCGHVALWRASDRRMLVFGGRDAANGTPSDSALYSLRFEADFATATWEKLSAVGPGPRFQHALGWDPDAPQRGAYLFGGEIAGGTKLNDLWRLNADSLIADSIKWDAITDLPGPAPSARSRHTATLIGIPSLLYVFGGRSDDSTVYVAHLKPVAPNELRTWTTYRVHNPALSGHTAIREGTRWARIPETFDPTAATGSQWTRLDAAPHKQNWYPQTFATGPDTVFVSGPDEKSYYLLLNSPQWIQFPSA